MNIFVAIKGYRQKDGEYMAVEVEGAFKTREAVDAFLQGKPVSWWETKPVPVASGGTVPVEFLGIRAVHETVLAE